MPVEVTIFGHETQPAFFKSLGCEPVLRMSGDKPFVTDNGNYIYDCRFRAIDNARELDRAFDSRAGVVETGLFLGIAKMAIVAGSVDVERITRD